MAILVPSKAPAIFLSKEWKGQARKMAMTSIGNVGNSTTSHWKLRAAKCVRKQFGIFKNTVASGFVYEGEQWVYSSAKGYAKNDGIIKLAKR